MCVLVFQSSLTPANYDSLNRHLSNEITMRFEKNIMKTTFNRVSNSCVDMNTCTATRVNGGGGGVYA